MFECKFNYDEDLIKRVSATTLKTSNLINEILISVIFIAVAVMLAMGYYIMGAIFAVVGAILVVGVIFINKLISRTNNMLIGQQVSIQFNDKDMLMVASQGDAEIYRVRVEYSVIKKVVEKNDLAFLYMNKNSVIIIPKNAFKTTQEYQKAMDLAISNYVV